jgi:serine/threonine-protein kinase
MGRVYRAFDPGLGREVALKTLSPAFRRDPASLRRVEREARLLATISHPNVGAIYGLERIEGAPYLVLELVEGDTLAERLERGPLSIGEATGVALQVAAALEEAHRRGVVHRDLKPANVKVSREGLVKVLDFGIAKLITRDGADGEAPAAGAATGTGVISGTAPYMSPEQIRGEPVDTRADVWAFGCLLYEMLSGERVFAGGSAPEVMAAVRGLAPKQRAVVVLFYLEDRPMSEIAAILGCPEGTARSHVHRALLSLRTKLEAGQA